MESLFPEVQSEWGSVNKKILITGGSSAIGQLLIQKQLSLGNVTIVAQYHSNENVKSAFKSIPKSSELIWIKCNLAEQDDIKKLLSHTESQFPLDAFVHLAAYKPEKSRITELNWNKFETHLNLQLKSLHTLVQSCLPTMAKAKSGKIITVLSNVTHGVPPSGMADYVTAKYAMLGYMKALASEYRSKGIAVNSVSPSMMDTPFISNLPSPIKDMCIENSPMKRLVNPAGVASYIDFLLSPEANHICGTNLVIDDGVSFP